MSLSPISSIASAPASAAVQKTAPTPAPASAQPASAAPASDTVSISPAAQKASHAADADHDGH
jgi:hypothetical protein